MVAGKSRWGLLARPSGSLKAVTHPKAQPKYAERSGQNDSFKQKRICVCNRHHRWPSGIVMVQSSCRRSRLKRKNQLRGDPYTPRAPGLDAKLCSTASIKESEGCTRSGIKKSPLVPAGSDVFCQNGTRLRRKSRSPASSAVLQRAGRRFPCSASGSKTGCLRQPSARGATRRCPRPSIRSG